MGDVETIEAFVARCRDMTPENQFSELSKRQLSQLATIRTTSPEIEALKANLLYSAAALTDDA